MPGKSRARWSCTGRTSPPNESRTNLPKEKGQRMLMAARRRRNRPPLLIHPLARPADRHSRMNPAGPALQPTDLQADLQRIGSMIIQAKGATMHKYKVPSIPAAQKEMIYLEGKQAFTK